MIPTVLATAKSDPNALNSLNQEEQFSILRTESEHLTNVFKNQSVNGIFIADTLGNIILRYSLSGEQQQAVMQSRDILADLRKLLKLSRIG